jgi:putative SOS response-associated peptidase YedK
VPVDNFYEWKKIDGGKQPYAIALADRSIMALAGLWENWKSSAGEWVRSRSVFNRSEKLKPDHAQSSWKGQSMALKRVSSAAA